MALWPAALIASVMSLTGLLTQPPTSLRNLGFILFHCFIIIYPGLIFFIIKLGNKLYANQKIQQAYILTLIPAVFTIAILIFQYLDNKKSKALNTSNQVSEYQQVLKKSPLLGKLMKPFILKEKIKANWIQESLEGISAEKLNKEHILFHVLNRGRIGFLGKSTSLSLAKKDSLIAEHAHTLKDLALYIINKGGELDPSSLDKRLDIRFAEHILRSTLTITTEELTERENPLVWYIVKSICLKRSIPQIKELTPLMSKTNLNKESTIYGTPLASLFLLKDFLRNQSSTFLIKTLISKGAVLKANKKIEDDLQKRLTSFVKKGHLR